jgi:transposase
LPVWAEVHRELKRKGVTLALLWGEYKTRHPEGLQYTQFCAHYRAWAGTLDVVMRQPHRAGEKLFVDYAGQTVPVIDRMSGAIREAQVFVAVLGASNYTYAEATWTQSLPDWIGSHVRTFQYLQAVPAIVVPDNLKSGVRCAHRYEPDLNPTYCAMATHFGVAVLPARAAKPRDKAKAEVGVQIVERWVLARLRNETFFSLAELNAAIRVLLQELNERPLQKLPGSRRTLFEQLDRPAMKPPPQQPYVYAEWSRARAHIDYHIEVDGHYYSVPYLLVKQILEVRLSAHTVEIFHRGQRVASHRRSQDKGRYTTLPEHMPEAHRAYAEWTPQRLVHWAENIGPALTEVVTAILRSRPHPQQGFRSCLGIMRLGKSYGEARLEAACRRAHALQSYSYKSIASILKHRLDQIPLPGPSSSPTPIAHSNIRGAQYYH